MCVLINFTNNCIFGTHICYNHNRRQHTMVAMSSITCNGRVHAPAFTRLNVAEPPLHKWPVHVHTSTVSSTVCGGLSRQCHARPDGITRRLLTRRRRRRIGRCALPGTCSGIRRRRLTGRHVPTATVCANRCRLTWFVVVVIVCGQWPSGVIERRPRCRLAVRVAGEHGAHINAHTKQEQSINAAAHVMRARCDACSMSCPYIPRHIPPSSAVSTIVKHTSSHGTVRTFEYPVARAGMSHVSVKSFGG